MTFVPQNVSQTCDAMKLNARIRPDRDDDIARWYEAQEDKSEAIREVIREHIERQAKGKQPQAELLELLPGLVARAVARGLERLPQMMRRAVSEALANYELEARVGGEKGAGGDVDAELAARLDEQFDQFFK